MKLARTIRLDVSDSNTYLFPAEPGEWAVTGTFAFASSDLNSLTNKDQIAFRYGWMGTQSFGRSTFVQVTTIAKEHYEETVRRLAAHIFESYSAPGMIDAWLRPVLRLTTWRRFASTELVPFWLYKGWRTTNLSPSALESLRHLAKNFTHDSGP